MHVKSEVMRAFIDGELSGECAEQVQAHLSLCSTCQVKFQKLKDNSQMVTLYLAAVSSREGEKPQAVSLALKQFTNDTRMTHLRKESVSTMFKPKPLWTALAVVAILAVALSLTSVRAWASEFLSLFRVEKITVVQFDPVAANEFEDKISVLGEAPSSVLEQNLVIMQEGEMREVNSVEEAEAAVGFTPRIPTSMKNVKLAFQPGAQAILTIDREPMQAILDALEMDVQLPKNADGKKITAVTQAGMVAASGCDPTSIQSNLPHDCTVLIQMPSPTVDAPSDLDMKKFGIAGFQLLGFSLEEATQLSLRIDWTSTLLLPVPKDGSIAVYDLAVDGVTGTLLIQQDENSYALLWLKDGMFYILRGPGWAKEAQTIADTMP